MEKLTIVQREELANSSNEEMQAKLEANMVVITEAANAINSADELKDLEESLMDVFKKNDEYLSDVKYDLENEVVYDETTFKRSDIVNKVIFFINRMEVEFRATLGIYQAIRYWKTKGSEPVSYAAFDSTLRMLGTLKYKGEAECRDILVINNWFAGAHDQYVKDNVYTNYLASVHQVIMNRMEQLEKESNEDAAAE